MSAPPLPAHSPGPSRGQGGPGTDAPLPPPANIFYVLEFRELFLTLFRKFNAAQQPRAFLRDLAGATHLFLRLLERFCRQRRSLVVQVSGRVEVGWGGRRDGSALPGLTARPAEQEAAPEEEAPGTPDPGFPQPR